MTDTAPQRPEVDEAVAALIAKAAASEDPYFSALAQTLLSLGPGPDGTDPQLRQRLEGQVASGVYEPPAATVTDTTAPGPHGPVPVRVYRPVTPGTQRPLFVWCHGGGFVGGDLDMPEADATAREVCTRADAVVVSVDYRLAKDGVHYPVPLDDVIAAYYWAIDTGTELGADPHRVTLGGASAGGNLAAGAGLRLRDEGHPPAQLLLLYPLVHPKLPSPSDELGAKLAAVGGRHDFPPVLTKVTVENYLGAPADKAHSYAMAALGDLHDYPRALMINCEYDGLRASGEAFAAALQAAGNDITVLLADNVLHGHINSPWLPQAQRTYAEMSAWVRNAIPAD
jgi:acetyl esterase/lipase